MKAQLWILTGVHAGHIEVFSNAYIAAGRHPASDLRFDPDRELDVSARHAAIVRRDDQWFVQDVGSRNGTFVNGRRITGETRLSDTDQIRLGEHGPLIEFRLAPDATPDGVSRPLATHGTRPTLPTAAADLRPTGDPRGARVSTTTRIRLEVGRQTRVLRRFAAILAVLLVAAGVGVILSARRQDTARARDVAAIQARTDSLLRTADNVLRALQGQVEGLSVALRQSQALVERLQRELAGAQRSGSPAEVETLTRQLQEATEALHYRQLAALVDYREIANRNQAAVALLWAEFTPGEVVTGTAFAVRADGVLLTNRHVVAGPEGTRRPTRLAVKFADSRQVWPARLLSVGRDADVATVQVDVRGGVPTVRGLNRRPDTLRQGDPVAVIGFPLGPDLPMSGSGATAIARTTFTAGSVSKVLDDLIQIDGYGTHGASGSPILDRNGEVVAILFAGQPGTSGRIVFGVPATFALSLVDSAKE